MTYPLLAGAILLIALAVRLIAVAVARRRGRPLRWAPSLIAGVITLVLTAAFDNLMIASGLFAYSAEHRSGIAIGLAPIEDFAYPIVAVLLLPAVWELLSPRARGGLGAAPRHSASGGEPASAPDARLGTPNA